MNTLTLSYRRYTDRSWQPSRHFLPGLLKLWYQRAHQRQQLAQLSDRELRDIGVSRAEAAAEAGKPFWEN